MRIFRVAIKKRLISCSIVATDNRIHDRTGEYLQNVSQKGAKQWFLCDFRCGARATKVRVPRSHILPQLLFKKFGGFNCCMYYCELKILIYCIMGSQINLFQAILNSPRTVFTVQALLMMSGFDDSKKITKSLHYYTNNGKILNPRKGVYSCSQGDCPPVSRSFIIV